MPATPPLQKSVIAHMIIDVRHEDGKYDASVKFLSVLVGSDAF